MTIDRRLFAGALGLSLVLAACGGASTASPAATAGSATAAPTDAPAVTAAPTEAAPTDATPTDAAATDDGGLPTGQTNDLADLLPETVNGVTYQRAGFDGDQLGAYGALAGIDTGDLEPLLQKYGKSLSDLNIAVATPSGATQVAGMIMAMQLEGVPATELMGGTGMTGSDMTPATIAGKEVYSAGAGGFGVTVYPKDDTLFLLLLADAPTTEAILAQLP